MRVLSEVPRSSWSVGLRRGPAASAERLPERNASADPDLANRPGEQRRPGDAGYDMVREAHGAAESAGMNGSDKEARWTGW